MRTGARLLALLSPLMASSCHALLLGFHSTSAFAAPALQPAVSLGGGARSPSAGHRGVRGGCGFPRGGCGGGWGGRRHVGGGSFFHGDDAARGRLTQCLLAARGGLGKEESKGRERRKAVDALLGFNVAVYILQLLSRDWLLNAGAMVKGMIRSGQFYRLLTPIFLHGGLIHLLCNSLSLNAVGPLVEMLFGTERLVTTYLIAGIGGNLASFYFGPPSALSVGASGAIFGLVGALAVFLLRHRELYGERSERMLNAIMQTCVINLLIGLIPGSRIDNWGHLGGAVAGAAMGYLIGPNLVRAGFGYADRPLVPLGFSK